MKKLNVLGIMGIFCITVFLIAIGSLSLVFATEDYGSQAVIVKLDEEHITTNPNEDMVLVSMQPGKYQVSVTCNNATTGLVVTKDPPRSKDIAKGKDFKVTIKEPGCVWLHFENAIPEAMTVKVKAVK